MFKWGAAAFTLTALAIISLCTLLTGALFEREREREREGETDRERERERQTDRQRQTETERDAYTHIAYAQAHTRL